LHLLAGVGPAQAQEADLRLNALFKDYLDEHFRQQPLEALSWATIVSTICSTTLRPGPVKAG